MSGGGSNSSGSSYAAQPAAAAALPPVTAPTFTANTVMPVGYQFPSNPGAMGSASTGVGTGAPNWAQGAWAMPWWGQPAPATGQALLQANQMGQYSPGAIQQTAQTAQTAQTVPATPTEAETQWALLSTLMGRGFSMDEANAIVRLADSSGQSIDALISQYSGKDPLFWGVPQMTGYSPG